MKSAADLLVSFILAGVLLVLGTIMITAGVLLLCNLIHLGF